MSGPVETELPPATAFRRRERLRLSLHRTPTVASEPVEGLKSRIRTINVDELAKKINHHKPQKYILLDCRGYLCYSDTHIRGAVHIACTDRFNRKRVQNNGISVLDLVSTNNRRNKTNGFQLQQLTNSSTNPGKIRDVIVYDEGGSDLNLEDSTWSNPISFVLAHLIQENRQPIYLTGGIKEFSRYYSDLCESCGVSSRREQAAMPTLTIPAPLSFQPCAPSSPTPMAIDSYENEPATQVLPYLYVGNARDAVDRDLLRRLGISYVLSVTTTKPVPVSHTNKPLGEANPILSNGTIEKEEMPEFHTKLIPVSDNLCENLAPYFEEAYEFIEEARTSETRVLVHCHAGISRSPTIAIAYIMKHINMSALDAYAFVQRSRHIISPNLNFMGQLIEYETKLKGFSSQSESSCSTSTSSVSSVSSFTSSTSESLSDDMDMSLSSTPPVTMTVMAD